MSIAPMSVPDRQPSPRLTVPLGSNNPFRNRTSSPSNSLLANPAMAGSRPVSTNPFLDESEALALQAAGTGNRSPSKSSKQDSDVADHASKLFDNLSLDDPSRPKERRATPSLYSENIPSGRSVKGKELVRPPPRPSKEDTPPHRPGKSSNQQMLIDVFADPQEHRKPHPHRRERRRRNSESSVMERPKPLDPEEDRRRRERRHKEREGRHKDKHHSRKNNSYKLDIIDKLDVTSVYGGVFHHDGPFDACNPHRNRKNLRNAPMQAFPKDSRNMALGGAGPNNSNIDLNQFHGRGLEGYSDYSTTNRQVDRFDPTARVEPIHGAESMGLGTSTFLEGAPASRAAIERRQSENETEALQNAGLQRKKSLAQKIRGINTRGGAGRVTSPEPLLRMSPVSSSSSKKNEKNPFFQDYDEAYEMKGNRIQEVADEAKKDGMRPRSMSSPKSIPGLEKRTGNDGTTANGETKTSGQSSGGGIGGGLMNRMKSLRKPRPDRRTIIGNVQ